MFHVKRHKERALGGDADPPGVPLRARADQVGTLRIDRPKRGACVEAQGRNTAAGHRAGSSSGGSLTTSRPPTRSDPAAHSAVTGRRSELPGHHQVEGRPGSSGDVPPPRLALGTTVTRSVRRAEPLLQEGRARRSPASSSVQATRRPQPGPARARDAGAGPQVERPACRRPLDGRCEARGVGEVRRRPGQDRGIPAPWASPSRPAERCSAESPGRAGSRPGGEAPRPPTWWLTPSIVVDRVVDDLAVGRAHGLERLARPPVSTTGSPTCWVNRSRASLPLLAVAGRYRRAAGRCGRCRALHDGAGELLQGRQRLALRPDRACRGRRPSPATRPCPRRPDARRSARSRARMRRRARPESSRAISACSLRRHVGRFQSVSASSSRARRRRPRQSGAGRGAAQPPIQGGAGSGRRSVRAARRRPPDRASGPPACGRLAPRRSHPSGGGAVGAHPGPHPSLGLEAAEEAGPAARSGSRTPHRVSSTPSSSRADSFASSTVLPVVSTHSMATAPLLRRCRCAFLAGRGVPLLVAAGRRVPVPAAGFLSLAVSRLLRATPCRGLGVPRLPWPALDAGLGPDLAFFCLGRRAVVGLQVRVERGRSASCWPTR